MKKYEIASVFTDYANIYIQKGFTFDTETFGGSYSEVEGNVLTLRKGNRFVVMWCERMSYGNYTDSIHARISEFVVSSEEDKFTHRWPYQWEDGLIIDKPFYQIGVDWYVDSKEEAMAAKAKKVERVRNRRQSQWVEVHVTDRMFNHARKFAGFKRIKRDELRVTKNNSYHVQYKFENLKSGRTRMVCPY